MSVTVRPDTAMSARTGLAAIKPGDYAGATVAKDGGAWQAPGSPSYAAGAARHGRGALSRSRPRPTQRIVTGAVEQERRQRHLTLHFAAASGSDGATCTGRAPASQRGCRATPVSRWLPGAGGRRSRRATNPSWSPGTVVAISVAAGPGWHIWSRPA